MCPVKCLGHSNTKKQCFFGHTHEMGKFPGQECRIFSKAATQATLVMPDSTVLQGNTKIFVFYLKFKVNRTFICLIRPPD